MLGTSSSLLFDVLAGVYDALGFGAVADETFRDLVISRVVEPTSTLDTGRVLTDLGQQPANERTMRRTLGRAQQRGYPDVIATACFTRAGWTRQRRWSATQLLTALVAATRSEQGLRVIPVSTSSSSKACASIPECSRTGSEEAGVDDTGSGSSVVVTLATPPRTTGRGRFESWVPRRFRDAAAIRASAHPVRSPGGRRLTTMTTSVIAPMPEAAFTRASAQ